MADKRDIVIIICLHLLYATAVLQKQLNQHLESPVIRISVNQLRSLGYVQTNSLLLSIIHTLWPDKQVKQVCGFMPQSSCSGRSCFLDQILYTVTGGALSWLTDNLLFVCLEMCSLNPVHRLHAHSFELGRCQIAILRWFSQRRHFVVIRTKWDQIHTQRACCFDHNGSRPPSWRFICINSVLYQPKS